MKTLLIKLLLFNLFIICTCKIAIAQDSSVDSLKKVLATEKEDTNKVKQFIDLSSYYMWSFADTAVMYAQKGLKLSQQLNYKKGEGICLIQLCAGLTTTGNFSSALDFGFRGLKIFEDLRDTTNLIELEGVLGGCYMDIGDYPQALVYTYRAKNLYELAPHSHYPWAGQVILRSISLIYQETNQPDSALYYANKSYELNKEWSGVLLSLGDIHAELGHNELSLDYYRKGIAVATQNQTYKDLSGIYIGMSKVFESAGNTDSAIYYADKSINAEGVNSYPAAILEASKQLARLYEIKKNNDSVARYLKLTIALNDSLFSKKKTREAQNFLFNEKLHQQELIAKEQENKNKIKLYALLGVIFIFLLIGFFLWRNNQHKQKANALLQQQKEKVESTLSELKSTQNQLIHSEKMASLGELTAGIAHEIQNPLNFVNNFSDVNKELLTELNDEIEKGNYDDAKAITKDVIDNEEKINHHGKRADAIVKGMLQHSKQTKGVKEPTDINALCDEYLRLSYHGMRAKDKNFNAEIKTDFDETIGNINIVPQDIGRVLLNLFNNAFYAVNEKKKAEDSVFVPTVTIVTKHPNSKVEIIVKDNGNGIPQNIIDKIFQPFFTTKPTGQGTGLGLSLAYDIITKEHNGTIKAESKEGEGSAFVIQLPLNEIFKTN